MTVVERLTHKLAQSPSFEGQPDRAKVDAALDADGDLVSNVFGTTGGMRGGADESTNFGDDDHSWMI